MPTASPVFDVDQTTFQRDVVDRSHEVPVVVDFWAAWCGPCRTLGPALEAAVAARGGEVELAKLDVDANPQLAASFRVQGIPAVKAFRNGQVVDQFTGALPPQQIEAFLDRVVPTAADRAAAAGRDLRETDPEAAEAELRRALEHEPRHRDAAVWLAELIVDDRPDEALDLVRLHRPFPAAEAVAARATLASGADVDEDALRARLEANGSDGAAHLELGRALAARGEYGEAIEHLLAAVEARGDTREPAREQLLDVFTLLGDDDDRVRGARPRLASALF